MLPCAAPGKGRASNSTEVWGVGAPLGGGLVWVLWLMVIAAGAEEGDLDAGDGPMVSALDGTTLGSTSDDTVWTPLVIVRGQDFMRPVSGLKWRLDPDTADGAPRASRLGGGSGSAWVPVIAT